MLPFPAATIFREPKRGLPRYVLEEVRGRTDAGQVRALRDRRMAAETRTDDELMQAFQAGNREALAALFDRHKNFVINLSYSMGGDQASAEDALQKTFVWIITHPAAYAPSGKFRAWLARIALNYSISEKRRRKTSREIPLESDVLREEPDGKMKTASRVISAREQKAQISLAIRSLPEYQRVVVALSYFAGLTHPEIAEVLECPEGTVKSRLNAALRNLSSRLGQGLMDARPGKGPGGKRASGPQEGPT